MTIAQGGIGGYLGGWVGGGPAVALRAGVLLLMTPLGIFFFL
jgi:hypothetical protein